MTWEVVWGNDVAVRIPNGLVRSGGILGVSLQAEDVRVHGGICECGSSCGGGLA